MIKTSITVALLRSRRRGALTILLLLGASGMDSVAQQESKPQPPMVVRVELVNVEVTVTDAQGHFVRDLKRENFRMLDEGFGQLLTHFAPVEAPAQVLVLVETGPAVYLIHREHLQAAYALLEGLAADDRVALGTYDESARPLMNFTEDKAALAQALGGLRYNLGMAQLNLFDSLGTALEWLAPLPGKKAIVLLTTGLDTSGAGHWETLASKLRASDVVILPVALGSELREPVEKSDRKSKRGAPAPRASGNPDEDVLSFAQADKTLETIAELTGGHAYFPRDARDFSGIYRQIAALLRHQYSLGFTPPARDARFHKIEIQIIDALGRVLTAPAAGPAPAKTTGVHGRTPSHPNPAYHISSRQGYVSPAP